MIGSLRKIYLSHSTLSTIKMEQPLQELLSFASYSSQQHRLFLFTWLCTVGTPLLSKEFTQLNWRGFLRKSMCSVHFLISPGIIIFCFILQIWLSDGQFPVLVCFHKDQDWPNYLLDWQGFYSTKIQLFDRPFSNPEEWGAATMANKATRTISFYFRFLWVDSIRNTNLWVNLFLLNKELPCFSMSFFTSFA